MYWAVYHIINVNMCVTLRKSDIAERYSLSNDILSCLL